jgi:hypothetical protein
VNFGAKSTSSKLQKKRAAREIFFDNNALQI